MWKSFIGTILISLFFVSLAFAQEAEIIKDKEGNLITTTNVNITNRINAYHQTRAPLMEGFESGTIPINWTILNEDGGTQIWNATTVNPHTGTYAARVRYETSSLDNDDWLITPPLDIQAGVEDTLKFWYRTYSNSYADSF